MAEDFSSLKTALNAEIKGLHEVVSSIAKDGIEVKEDTVYVDPARYEDVVARKARIAQIKNLLVTDTEIKDLRDFLDKPVEAPAVYGNQGPAESKTLADLVLESPQFKNMVENNRTSMSEDFVLEQPDVVRYGTEQKHVYTSLSAGTLGGIGVVADRLDTFDRPRLTSRVRDLFPVAGTSANLIEYFKVTGLVENSGRGNAATVPEYSSGNFGLKPQSTLAFTSAQDPVRTIAHWEAAHRNVLTDKPQLKSIINSELLYGPALTEDQQILNGDGTGTNLVGLLNRAGIQTYVAPGTGVTAELKSDSLRRSLTLCELALFPATGFVIHPNDWEDIELQKASGTGNYMITTNVVTGAQKRVWQTPVVSTPAITENTFLTAAFGTAAKLYDRESANIRISEHHSDFFIRNAVVILAEERLALTTPRPEAIVKGTFAV